jgi:hypothetical protein
MSTVRDDLVKKWKDDRHIYVFAGSCMLASSDAKACLEGRTDINKSAVARVSGLLTTTHGLELRFTQPRGAVAPDMTTRDACTQTWALQEDEDGDGACIWKLIETHEPRTITGGLHHIMRFDESDELMDWSLDQFIIESAEARAALRFHS